MKQSKSDTIEQFIRESLTLDEEKGRILISLRETILEKSSAIKEEIKYSGLVYILDSELIAGIFIRKKHVSLEFGFGYKMSDPENYLEGTGKYRRHLKLFNEKDLLNKNVDFFVTQMFE